MAFPFRFRLRYASIYSSTRRSWAPESPPLYWSRRGRPIVPRPGQLEGIAGGAARDQVLQNRGLNRDHPQFAADNLGSILPYLLWGNHKHVVGMENILVMSAVLKEESFRCSMDNLQTDRVERNPMVRQLKRGEPGPLHKKAVRRRSAAREIGSAW
jgi:hypothetical protein